MRQIDISLDKLFVSALNARKDLRAGQEDSGIEELASSIRQQGLLSPPIVRPTLDGRFEVLVGQRRLLACRKIGFDPVPCLVREDLGDSDAVTLSLVENVHRADMHPLDKARALKALYGVMRGVPNNFATGSREKGGLGLGGCNGVNPACSGSSWNLPEGAR
jgi:ParB family chromosome partitioning protein